MNQPTTKAFRRFLIATPTAKAKTNKTAENNGA